MLVSRTFSFDSAHYLSDYYGKCERMHGHTYKLEVTLEGKVQPNGLVIDFVVLKRLVKKYVLNKLDHQVLNDIVENPSAERMVIWIWDQLKDLSKLLKEEMDDPNFLTFVKDKFNLKVNRHSDLISKKIKRVGVLGGSGASGIKAAKSQKCDAYLTGDVKYHDFFQSEGKMLICDIGHYESEQFVTQQLVEILSEIFPKFAVSKSVEKTNPVNYFL